MGEGGPACQGGGMGDVEGAQVLALERRGLCLGPGAALECFR